VTSYEYDARGRLLLQTNPTAPHAFHSYDNEGRRIATGLFSSVASITVGTDDPTTETTNRLALTRQYYDDNGRLWKSTRHNIDSSDGSDDDNLEHLRWYDAGGRILKEDGPQLLKYVYDRLGRRTRRQVIADDNDTVYANVDDVTGDYLVEESVTAYDTDTDEVWMQVRIDRKHNDWTVSPTTGNLETNSDGDDLLLTNTDVKGRAQITCFWYDRFGRRTDQVLYGTYNAATFDRDGISVPTRSDTELVTSYAYGTDGAVSDVTDPRGLVRHTDYDDAGRKTAEIRNYSASVNSGLPANPDDNQTVRYEYTDGLRTKLTADMPSGETDQHTVYIYGTTKGTPSANKIASGHLLRAVKYPDTTNSGTTLSAIDTDSSDVVSYAYNAQGQVIYQKDQAGNVFDVAFDDSGRETSWAVSTLASGFDGDVRLRARTYDDLGRPSLVTQYDATTSGSVTDEAAYTYDGWGGVTSFKQDKDSAVGASGYYEVAYSYEKATGGRNAVRRSSMTLPGSRTITIDYTRYKDDELSRVSKLKDGATNLVRYTYMGDSRVVGSEYPEPDISSLAFDSTSGSHTGYLDRHNRILQSRWSTDAPNPSIDFYQVDLEYDRNSNITWAEDNVHEGHDVMYTMDDLDRLIDAEEGTRSGSSITSRTRHQTWLHSSTSQLSHTGNWTRSKLDINGDDDWSDTDEYDDSRTHNTVNELTARDVDSDATDDYTLSYDAAGDLTDDGEDYKYEYDAFYRLRKVRDQSDTLVAEYRYNGLGHMIGVHEDTDDDGDADGSDVWFYPAYDEAWREVARYRESDSSPKEQFVNACAGPDGYGRASYINDVVCRDRDANAGWTSASDGTLEERYYYCPNWRGDVSVLVTSGAQLHERPKYSPYGIPNASPGADLDSDGDCDATDATIVQGWIDTSHYDVRGDIDLDGDVDSTDKSTAAGTVYGTALGWTVNSSESLRNTIGWSGSQLGSPLSRLLHVRVRAICGSSGRWIERDPAWPVDGASSYECHRSDPLGNRDPSGLTVIQGGLYSWLQYFGGAGDCCENARAGHPGAFGATVCCNGAKKICTYNPLAGGSPSAAAFGEMLKDCAEDHELEHRDASQPCPAEFTTPGATSPPPYDSFADKVEGNLNADIASRDCMQGKKDSNACGADIDCSAMVDEFLGEGHDDDGTPAPWQTHGTDGTND
jgi:RHS repeat-associated protein